MKSKHYFKENILSIFLICILLLAGCSSFDDEASDNATPGNTSESAAFSPEKDADSRKGEKADYDVLPEGAGSAGNDVTPAEMNGSDSTENQLQEDEPVCRVVVLDPGHGGIFPGAHCRYGDEKDMNLKVAEYAKEYLEANVENIRVLLTRDEDTELSENLVQDLILRADLAQDAGAEIFVSMHFNASENHNIDGSQIYVSNRPEVNEQCTILAECIMKELTAIGLDDGGVHTRNSSDMKDENGKPLDYYAINRHCAARGIPGIIIEHCFIDNEYDLRFVAGEEALRILGEADARGIAEYLKNPD